MLKIGLVFWECEPQYAYKRYAYKKNMYALSPLLLFKLHCRPIRRVVNCPKKQWV